MPSISNESILDGALEYAIDMHLEIHEEKEEMLSKFKGNKINMVNFLRNRSAEASIKESPVPYIPTPSNHIPLNNKKSKKKSVNKSQSNLF